MTPLAPPVATWSIVTTMQGLPETTLPAIAHHLQSDVARIYVYLDSPDPVLERALGSHPRCDVTVCDAAYWADTADGMRPEMLPQRQRRNALEARLRCDSDWLVHIDSDEFLVPGGSDETGPLRLSEELARIPPRIGWARLGNMERVLPAEAAQDTLFDGLFRDQIRDPALAAYLLGDNQPFLKRGFSGYVRGKVAIRPRCPLRLRLHDALPPRRPGQPHLPDPVVLKAADLPPFRMIRQTRLLHFDGWTPLHWTLKLLKFADTQRFTGHHPGRVEQVRFMHDSDSPAARLGLFDRLQRLSAPVQARMAAEGLLRQTPFSAIAAAQREFPDVPMAFSAAEFDARLRRTQAETLRRHGLDQLL